MWISPGGTDPRIEVSGRNLDPRIGAIRMEAKRYFGDDLYNGEVVEICIMETGMRWI